MAAETLVTAAADAAAVVSSAAAAALNVVTSSSSGSASGSSTLSSGDMSNSGGGGNNNGHGTGCAVPASGSVSASSFDAEHDQDHSELDAASSSSGAIPGFEGPEKILEIDFDARAGGSLRSLPRKDWDAVLDLARCQILSKISNEHLDAYVLSESSLFVYDKKAFIKTCGTTTLLRCLPLLLERAAALGLQLEWIGYTRKNYIFPEVQAFPHGSFAQEIEYTKRCAGPTGQPLNGGAYILGDLTADHWYVYVADYCAPAQPQSPERNVNIMMYGLDPEVCRAFFRRPERSLEEDATRAAGQDGARVHWLCGDDARVDDRMFEPCGYSMNAVAGHTFYTLHVTPEEEFSYASFETNLEAANYDELMRRVVSVFRPKRFVVTMFADEAALAQTKSCPTQMRSLEAHCEYTRQTQSTTCIREDYACRMSVYTQQA